MPRAGDFSTTRARSDLVVARSLRGYGPRPELEPPGKIGVNLTVAWRDTGPGLTDGGDRNPRLFWSIQKAF